MEKATLEWEQRKKQYVDEMRVKHQREFRNMQEKVKRVRDDLIKEKIEELDKLAVKYSSLRKCVGQIQHSE